MMKLPSLIAVLALSAPLLASAAAAAPPPLPPGTPAFASLKGDPAAGKAAFNACRVCHVAISNENRIGPTLHGVVGRASGSVKGYNYSAANKAIRVVWTEPALYAYLLAPQAYMPGTRMTYGGLKDAQKRADVIAYLKTKPAS